MCRPVRSLRYHGFIIDMPRLSLIEDFYDCKWMMYIKKDENDSTFNCIFRGALQITLRLVWKVE
uniref:Uncharacterized protein n=1 Tax=Rhizophora mucronata TaxID=61149 RepID=A0A2P2N581_RHIMU